MVGGFPSRRNTAPEKCSAIGAARALLVAAPIGISAWICLCV
jgi:hypothetical protein